MDDASRHEQSQQELANTCGHPIGRTKFKGQGGVSVHRNLNGTMRYL
jgi:hypothetical protein